MSSGTKDLENKIEALENRIEALSARCHDLERRMIRMAVSKISDPRYPYWNWFLCRGASEEEMLKLNVLLSAMHGRVTGSPLPNETNKSIDGVSLDLLSHGSGPLPVEQVFAAIKRVAGMEGDWQVVELIRVVHEQGMFQELCEYVLSSSYVASLQGRDFI
jgi:hypothetical protein